MLFLLLLLQGILLCFFVNTIIWKKRTIRKIGNPNIVKKLFVNYSKLRFFFKFFFCFIALGLLAFIFYNFKQPYNNFISNNTDIIIAIDASKSMLCNDVKNSRLEQAKNLANKIVAEKGNSRIGIIAFAGKAFLQMPISNDTTEAKSTIELINPSDMPVGSTNIGDALHLCNVSFNSQENSTKKIILITDGEDLDTSAISEAKKLAGKNIAVYTIGIGTTKGVQVVEDSTANYKKDNIGNVIISKLNEPLLKNIAEITKGKYIGFDNSDIALEGLVFKNDDNKKGTENTDFFGAYNYSYWLFVIPAFLLILIEIFISEERKIKTL